MKKAELRKLIAEYMCLKAQSGNNLKNRHIADKLKEIEHRYFHETGQQLDLENQN